MYRPVTVSHTFGEEPRGSAFIAFPKSAHAPVDPEDLLDDASYSFAWARHAEALHGSGVVGAYVDSPVHGSFAAAPLPEPHVESAPLLERIAPPQTGRDEYGHLPVPEPFQATAFSEPRREGNLERFALPGGITGDHGNFDMLGPSSTLDFPEPPPEHTFSLEKFVPLTDIAQATPQPEWRRVPNPPPKRGAALHTPTPVYPEFEPTHVAQQDAFTDYQYVNAEMPRDPSCWANPGCEELEGLCCPTQDGLWLGCCAGVAVATSIEAVGVEPGSSACTAHPGCAGLEGACCPTLDGLWLGCCDQW